MAAAVAAAVVAVAVIVIVVVAGSKRQGAVQFGVNEYELSGNELNVRVVCVSFFLVWLCGFHSFLFSIFVALVLWPFSHILHTFTVHC